MAVSIGNVQGVVSLALQVRQLGENVYNASSALETFRADVTKLEQSFQAWERTARKFGVSEDISLGLSVQEGKDRLQREESRLRRLVQGGGCLWCFWLSLGTTFPAELGKTIVSLNETIQRNERSNEDAYNNARRTAERLARRPTFGFKRDQRYVQIHGVEQELKQLLRPESSREKTGRVISLYGRAGCGKSSMARHLALDFEEAMKLKLHDTGMTNAAGSEEPNVDRAARLNPGGPETLNSEGDTASALFECCQFEDVFYLDCGPKASTEVKLEQLLGNLLWEDPSQKENIKKYKEDRVMKGMLSQMLRERQSLLILDDVWEDKFLKEMVGVCGERMKILVTTQKKRLCDQCLLERAEAVSMDTLTQYESFQILRTHAGFGNEDEVPAGVKNYMDRLLEKVGGHPHALASIGARVDAEYKTEQSQWHEIFRAYEAILDSEDRIESPLQDVRYERSVTGAIQLKLEPLGPEERQILVLMAMSRGRRTPQHVIQLLHHELFVKDKIEGARSSMSFFRARKMLKDFQWIRTETAESGESWSLHLLDEQFIQKRVNSELDELILKFQNLPHEKIQGLRPEPQPNIMVAFGILYLTIPPSAGTVSSLINSWPDWRHHWTRQISETLISLMVTSVGGCWSAISQKSADQIFLDLMVQKRFHVGSLKSLLKSPLSKHLTWAAMKSQWRWQWEPREDIIIAVLQIYGDLDLQRYGPRAEIPFNREQCLAIWDLQRLSNVLAAPHMKRLVPKLVYTTTSPNTTTLEIKYITTSVLYHLAQELNEGKVYFINDKAVQSIVQYVDDKLAGQPLTNEGKQERYSLEKQISLLLSLIVKFLHRYHDAVFSSLQKFIFQFGRDSFRHQKDLNGEREGGTDWRALIQARIILKDFDAATADICLYIQDCGFDTTVQKWLFTISLALKLEASPRILQVLQFCNQESKSCKETVCKDSIKTRLEQGDFDGVLHNFVDTINQVYEERVRRERDLGNFYVALQELLCWKILGSIDEVEYYLRRIDLQYKMGDPARALQDLQYVPRPMLFMHESSPIIRQLWGEASNLSMARPIARGLSGAPPEWCTRRRTRRSTRARRHQGRNQNIGCARRGFSLGATASS